MFKVELRSESGFDKVVLKDTDTNSFAEIIPSCGAILHAFGIEHNGSLINVIENYNDNTDFKMNVAGKGFKSCKLSPFACRIKDAVYNFSDKKYTIEKFLLGKHALHGLIYDASFEIISTEANDQHVLVSMQYKYNATDPGYPFEYTCIVTYTLKKNNALTILTEVSNDSKSPMPIQDGWHPYFTFGKKIDDLQLEFQSKERMIFNDMIPTGEKVHYEEFGSLKKIEQITFDDCFTMNFAECQPLCVLRDPERKLQIEIFPAKSYPYLQLYTPDHRQSIAIENLSAPPDTFNNGIDLKILSPNEKANFTTIYKITSLPLQGKK
ncbi:MAG: aldose 1-epimerase [Bacteroidota bacterium]